MPALPLRMGQSGGAGADTARAPPSPALPSCCRLPVHPLHAAASLCAPPSPARRRLQRMAAKRAGDDEDDDEDDDDCEQTGRHSPDQLATPLSPRPHLARTAQHFPARACRCAQPLQPPTGPGPLLRLPRPQTTSTGARTRRMRCRPPSMPWTPLSILRVGCTPWAAGTAPAACGQAEPRRRRQRRLCMPPRCRAARSARPGWHAS